MTHRTCSDCGCSITKSSRSGRCWDCYQARRANGPNDAVIGSARLLDAIQRHHGRPA